MFDEAAVAFRACEQWSHRADLLAGSLWDWSPCQAHGRSDCECGELIDGSGWLLADVILFKNKGGVLPNFEIWVFAVGFVRFLDGLWRDAPHF